MANFEQTSLDLRRMIDTSLGADRVHETRVAWYRDHVGEPAISLGVTMKAARDIPDAKQQSALTHELVKELDRLEERRFPYLYFDALDMDQSPEDADEFERSDDLSEPP